MVTHDGDEAPDIADSLTFSVWTPTPEEQAILRALEDELDRATTREARREARRRVDEHFREMQERHRDDPPTVSLDSAAVEALRARQMEELQRQLDNVDDDPPPPPSGSASSN